MGIRNCAHHMRFDACLQYIQLSCYRKPVPIHTGAQLSLQELLPQSGEGLLAWCGDDSSATCSITPFSSGALFPARPCGEVAASVLEGLKKSFENPQRCYSCELSNLRMER